MSTEITKALKCVVLNGGIEMWVDESQAEKVFQAIEGGLKHLKLNGELINTFSIVGVFTAQTMEERIRRRNGEWQCAHGNWWGKGLGKCECSELVSEDVKQRIEASVRQKYGITD